MGARQQGNLCKSFRDVEFTIAKPLKYHQYCKCYIRLYSAVYGESYVMRWTIDVEVWDNEDSHLLRNVWREVCFYRYIFLLLLAPSVAFVFVIQIFTVSVCVCVCVCSGASRSVWRLFQHTELCDVQPAVLCRCSGWQPRAASGSRLYCCKDACRLTDDEPARSGSFNKIKGTAGTESWRWMELCRMWRRHMYTQFLNTGLRHVAARQMSPSWSGRVTL